MNPQCAAKRRNLRVQNQGTAAGPIIRQHHSAHLVEEQLPGNPAEPVEGSLQRFHQHRHRLPG